MRFVFCGLRSVDVWSDNVVSGTVAQFLSFLFFLFSLELVLERSVQQ